MYEEIDAQLTAERKELNSVEQAIKSLLDTKLSYRPTTTLALRSCQLASMWLGKAKGALGIKTPYPESFNPESKVIEARADVGEALEVEADEIAAVKTLRAKLSELQTKITNDGLIMLDHRGYQHAVVTAYTHCSEASMWLGMTLNAIKEEPVKSKKKDKGIIEKAIDSVIGKAEEGGEK